MSLWYQHLAKRGKKAYIQSCSKLSVANGKVRPRTMGLGIWVEAVVGFSSGHERFGSIDRCYVATVLSCVGAVSLDMVAHDETARAPSSWHVRSSDALWRARTFAQAHCNSQKLAAGHRKLILLMDNSPTRRQGNRLCRQGARPMARAHAGAAART